jgi:hypothetical protein
VRGGWAGALVLGALVFAAAPALAYRPFDETDADVSAHREIELELGPVAVIHQPAGWTYAPGFIFNYGFWPRFELVIDAHDAFLFGGPDLAARRRLLETGVLVKSVLRPGSLQGETGPSVAAELGALLPSVPAAGGVGGSLAVIVSQRWESLTVHLNGEGDLTREGDLAVIAGVIIEGPDRWPVRPVAERLTEHQTNEPATYSALGGAIWRASEALSPDLAVRVAREAGEQVVEIRAGLTWAFQTRR